MDKIDMSNLCSLNYSELKYNAYTKGYDAEIEFMNLIDTYCYRCIYHKNCGGCRREEP